MKTSTLVFEGQRLHTIEREGQLWIRGGQIAATLEYRHERDFRDLYARHADEFTPSMTAEVRLPTAGGMQLTRIFSLRGAHMLGMLSKTAPAKRFRHWVLDVLEQHGSQDHGQISLPLDMPLSAPVIGSSNELDLLRQLHSTQTRLIELLDAKLTKPPRQVRRELTPKDVQLIRSMHSEGMSIAAIARELKRSTATVSWLVRPSVH